MTRRELAALVPFIVMLLIALAAVVPWVSISHAALTPAMDTEANVPNAELHPWSYTDGRHGAPEGSTGLVWDRAQAIWTWDYSPARRAKVVMVIVDQAGVGRALVFTSDYASGRHGPPMDFCRRVAVRYRAKGEQAACLVTADD